MDAAVVELYPLADADRSAADNNRLIAGKGFSLVFDLIRAVEIGSFGIELGRTGVYHFIYRFNIPAVSQLPHLVGQHVSQG